MYNLRKSIVFKSYFITGKGNQNIESDDADQLDEIYENRKDNPWKWPISNISTGILLTTFTFNFRNLQYILPTIGILMIFFGFRSLQGVNDILRRAWFLSIFRLIYQIICLVILASPWYLRDNYNLILGILAILYQIIFLLVFRKGMRLLFQDIGMKPKRDPILYAIVWYVFLVLIALFGSSIALLAIIPMIIWLLAIITSISNYSEDLEFTNYNFNRVKGIKSNRCLGLGYLLLCFLFVFVTSAISNHLRLDSSVMVPGTEEKSRAMLMELGFPEHILNDLSDETIGLIQKATFVESYVELLMFDPKDVNTSKTKNLTIMKQYPGNSNMETTTVYMEANDGNLYVLEYFEWIDGSAYWQDGFNISGYMNFELLEGHLLYEEDEVDYIASIPRLICESVIINNMFGASQNYQISGSVSYPFGTNHQRGYVLYRVPRYDELMSISFLMNYIHQSSPLKFPYTETEQDLMKWGSGCKQHYTNYALKAYHDGN